MKHHIFISYSRHDTELMRRLVTFFQSEGLTVWFDDQLIPGTPDWVNALEDAIINAGCIVAILSPEAKASEWVGKELGACRIHDRPIFPILVRGKDKDAVPMELVNAQYADARKNEQDAFKKLLRSVTAHLRIESKSQYAARLEQEAIQMQKGPELERLKQQQEYERQQKIEREARRLAEQKLRGSPLLRRVGCAFLGCGGLLIVGIALMVLFFSQRRPTDFGSNIYNTNVPSVPSSGLIDAQVSAACDSPGNPLPPSGINTNTLVSVYWGWFASTSDQIWQHVDSARYNIQLDGMPLDIQSAQFGGVQPTNNSTLGTEYMTLWQLYLGKLSRGTHQVSYYSTWIYQIFDGVSYYGPGTSHPDEFGSCTFVVA